MIEERIATSKDIADLYFNCSTVQTTTLDLSLAQLANSNIDCDEITNFDEVLDAMPIFKCYLERTKNR